MPSSPKGKLLYIHALTALHPGTGGALDVVDLPVQRERHTDWPTIPGTSIKGVLRDHHRRGHPEAEVERLFGKGGDEGGFEAGLLAFTDARLLGFPVRSLYGVFAWVTCPQVLQRWQRDAAIAGITLAVPGMLPSEGQALAPNRSPCRAPSTPPEIILEEFSFRPADLSSALPLPEGIDPSRFLVLPDDDFTYFARNATEVTARIALKHETKTVRKGALFYEEFVPAETLFYSLILSAERSPELPVYHPPEIIQLGGDETTGKGICHLIVGAEK